MTVSREEIEKILSKYQSKLEKRLSNSEQYTPDPNFSREYSKFKEEATSRKVGKYEKLCNFSETIIKTNPPEKDLAKIKESIEVTHLNISPQGASSFAILLVGILVIFSLFLGIVSFVSSNYSDFGFILGALFVSLIAILTIKPITRIPINLATKWRLRVNDQMILCILYMVIYMRHTSNFENAIKFASDHVGNPLALDMRKIFWDVETGKYSTIKESLESYLGFWRNYNLEFVNSFHLLESSLYEPSETRRLELLDKSLSVILEGTQDRMMKYAHDLQNPIIMLHMLGVILPILGLVIFPLVGAFMTGVKWYHLAIVYNLFLPIVVYNVGLNILSKRPSGHSESDIKIPQKKGPVVLTSIFIFIFLLIGFTPFIVHAISPGFELTFFGKEGEVGSEKFLDFECFDTSSGSKCYGPFGLGSIILSFSIPIGIAVSLAYYFRKKSKEGKKIRDETKKLEKEFSTGLFQLGTRIGDGIPSEIAFRDVAKTLEGTPTGNLFNKIHYNLSSLGMSLNQAVFDKENGAINDYPSPLVKSSMEVLIESSKKGPKIVSQSLLSISSYVNNVGRVNERLKDLLAEVISSMKSQISFMAPVIAGIVVGIASMIVGIISKLGEMLQRVNSGSSDYSLNVVNLSDLFQKTQAIPGYFFQIVVGLYVVQVVYVLTVLSNGIEFGADKLNEQHSLGKNLLRSSILYFVISLVVVLLFNLIAGSVLSSTQM
jgi:hypothetical protein